MHTHKRNSAFRHCQNCVLLPSRKTHISQTYNDKHRIDEHLSLIAHFPLLSLAIHRRRLPSARSRLCPVRNQSSTPYTDTYLYTGAFSPRAQKGNFVKENGEREEEVCVRRYIIAGSADQCKKAETKLLGERV